MNDSNEIAMSCARAGVGLIGLAMLLVTTGWMLAALSAPGYIWFIWIMGMISSILAAMLEKR